MRMPRLPFFAWRFEVSGLNLERFIAMIEKAHIPLLGIQRTDARTLLCKCCASDLPAVTALADEKGWRIRRLSPLGLSAVLAFLKKRPGIPSGLILAVVMLTVLSRFIWHIDVHGAGSYEAEVKAYLTECGMKPGRLRSSVNAKALEQQLSYRYPELAWMRVYVSNVTLVVDVTQGVSMPPLPSTEPAHLFAVQDGVVESVRVFAGTAAVQPGDTVRKGQILIRGQERGRDGETVYVHADGIVMARCFKTESVSIPVYEVISRETGRESTQQFIRTPWFTLPKPAGAKYLCSNIYKKQIPVGGCFFPLVLETLTHREVAMEYAQRDVAEVQKEAADAALSRLKNALHGYEIIDKWVDYCMIEDESVSARASAEWLMDIGGRFPP